MVVCAIMADGKQADIATSPSSDVVSKMAAPTVVIPTSDEASRTDYKSPPSQPLNSALRESAMSASDLSQFTFDEDVKSTDAASTMVQVRQPSEAIPASSSSSTCTRESDAALSDVECYSKNSTATTPIMEKAMERLNAKVSQQKTSRQGRTAQRMATQGDETIRLVTGCVPILRGGKILLVSSSRKPEWILPKGGWEQDEVMEESAVRETFEEAGILGVLGPRLKCIQYETRKAKKRRLELEEARRVIATKTADADNKTKGAAVRTPSQAENNKMDPPSSASQELTEESLAMLQGSSGASNSSTGTKASDDTASNTSTSTHSQVRLTLFPLYVSKIHEDWPESGRFRKAVSIEEAIQVFDSRPEFKSALEEVKQRGLHLRT